MRGKRQILTRRQAISTAAKVAVSAVVAGVIGGVGGYLAGGAAAPTVTVKETKRETVTTTLVSTKTITASATTAAPAPIGKECGVKLRPGLYFADGTPVTADDVVRSIDRVAKIEGDPAWFILDVLDEWKAVDERTVKFTLKEPLAFFPALMAVPPYFPVHPDYKPDEIDSDQTAGGVGPYKITKWVRDVELVLEANPYWYGGLPKTKEVVVRFYKDATAMRMALEAGEIDIAWRTLRPTDIQDLKKKEGLKVDVVPGGFIRYIVFNMHIPPFDDPKVRKALAVALDRKRICETVFLGTMKPLYSMIPMGMWSHIDAFEPYNPEKAKELLLQAGYNDNNPLEVPLWWTPTHYGPTEQDVAAVLKSSLEKTGVIKVNLQSAEWASYVHNFDRHNMLLFLLGWYPDYIDPDDYLSPFAHSGSASNGMGIFLNDKKMDDLLEKAARATTIEERTKYYKEIQEYWTDICPTVPLFQGKLYLITQKNISGVKVAPTMIFNYDIVEKK